MIDLEAGLAHWFDFETVHQSTRTPTWCRTNDVRALLATCLLRTAPEEFAGIVALILTVYADDGVTRLLASHFTSIWRRALSFHLGQAGLSFQCFQQIGRLLEAFNRREGSEKSKPQFRQLKIVERV